MTRLKIDLVNGILEVEGEESFVSKLYEDFKGVLNAEKGKEIKNHARKVAPAAQDDSGSDKGEVKIRKKRKGGSGETFKYLDDVLDKQAISDLKTFYKEKSPRNGFERNAVYVYFLQVKRGVSHIGVNHIYTCHKLTDVPVPKALKQSLFDTAFKKNTLNTSDIENVTITTLGENLVEHTLPVKKEK